MLLRLAFALVIAAPASTLEVCGNYCGPGWCNGASMPECSNGGYDKLFQVLHLA